MFVIFEMQFAAKYFFSALILACVFNVTGYAQEYYFKQFTTDQGLPHNQVRQVMEDNDGYLWIATDGGIVSYDGYHFEAVKHNNKLLRIPFFNIHRGKSGKLFFSGRDGRILVREDQAFSYKNNGQTKHTFPPEHMLIAYSVYEKNDSLWVQYNNSKSEILAPDSTVSAYKMPAGIHYNLQDSHLFYEEHTEQGFNGWNKLHITWPDGTNTIDSVKMNITIYDYDTRRMFYSRVGNWDIFCMKEVILIYKDKKKYRVYYTPKRITAFAAKGVNDIYIAYESSGVKKNTLDSAAELTVTDSLFENMYVTDIYFDREGGQWFSTRHKGLYYQHPTQLRYWKSDNEINTIEQYGNRVVITTLSGTVNVFEDGRLYHKMQIPLQKDELLKQCFYYSKDHYFAITDQRIFAAIPGRKKEFLPSIDYFDPDVVYPINKEIFFSFLINSKDLWNIVPLKQATTFGWHFTFRKFKDNKTILFEPFTNAIFKDSSNEYWITSADGVSILDKYGIKDLSKELPIFNTRIISLGQLSTDLIVLATWEQGIVLYNKRDKKVYNFTESNGLPTSVIHAMQVVGDTIWLSTNIGILSITFNNNKFGIQQYSNEMALPAVDIWKFSICNGWLYFPWADNICVLPLRAIPALYQQRPPIIKKIEVGNTAIDFSANNDFKYFQNDFVFEFININFNKGAQQKYRYRLKGLYTDKWFNTDERKAIFIDLPPGAYVFETEMTNAINNPISPAAAYSFTIHPPFWKTAWFYALLISAFILGCVVIFYLRLRSIKRKNKMILEKNAMLLDLSEYQQKALVHQISPHFIFNSLFSIQSAILKELHTTAYDITLRFAKLMRLMLDLSAEKSVLLEREILFLNKYLELELERFPGRFEYHFEVNNIKANVKIPNMLVQPFVENAIKHGLSHLKNRKGKLNISFSQLETVIICVVEDNGIGRERATMINSNLRKSHRSVGIDITVKRLQLLHQQEGTEYQYTVEDKYAENGEAIGTSVIFSLPVY